MTDKTSIESRRKLLKSIAAGSGVIVAGKSLPENWTKPVVDSVLLPVHAQTSQQSLSCKSTAAPFGTNVPPGPNVDNTNPITLPIRVTVTPPPVAPDNVATWSAYLDGSLAINPQALVLAADGTAVIVINNVGGNNGVFELRVAWQAEQCSLFWNLFTA